MNLSTRSRRLFSGRIVQDLKESVVVIESKCPTKWVCIDLETGDKWVMENDRHRPANACEKKEAIKILNMRKR